MTFGIGLAIVKKIVELCSGSVEVESKLGEGNHVLLHVAQEADGEEPEPVLADRMNLN